MPNCGDHLKLFCVTEISLLGETCKVHVPPDGRESALYWGLMKVRILVSLTKKSRSKVIFEGIPLELDLLMNGS